MNILCSCLNSCHHFLFQDIKEHGMPFMNTSSSSVYSKKEVTSNGILFITGCFFIFAFWFVVLFLFL